MEFLVHGHLHEQSKTLSTCSPCIVTDCCDVLDAGRQQTVDKILWDAAQSESLVETHT